MFKSRIIYSAISQNNWNKLIFGYYVKSIINPFETHLIIFNGKIQFRGTSYGIYDSSVPPYYIYSVTLEDLNPNTKYYYRVPQIYQNAEIYNLLITQLILMKKYKYYCHN